jgi:hypothetical protein
MVDRRAPRRTARCVLSAGALVVLVMLIGVLAVEQTVGAPAGAGRRSRGWPAGGCLRLRGGGDAVRPLPTLHKVASRVDTLAEEETKPDLKRNPSRLVLHEGHNVTAAVRAPKLAYRIDGKEVTEAEYNSRVKGVTSRALDSWISDSDRGGFKEGVDIIVPDHCPSVPEAVARVAHDGTVYIRNGTYKWEGVLVVQKHMHLRGEPNPDEGPGYVCEHAFMRVRQCVSVWMWAGEQLVGEKQKKDRKTHAGGQMVTG